LLGYGALGAVVTTKEVAKAMEFESSFYSTYGWHPLNVAAAIANIKFFLKIVKKKLLFFQL
jgi:adenosylmethionine-8-amino-7-oxononanoate aminotransferase